MSIINDLIHSFHQVFWEGYLFEFRWAIPLYFVFGKISHRRWTSVHYEECLILLMLYPFLYKAFMSDDFVVHQTQGKGTRLFKFKNSFMQMAHVVAADQEMQYEFFTFKSIFHNNIYTNFFALRTYNTIKTCRWNLFSWVVHYRKIYKN